MFLVYTLMQSLVFFFAFLTCRLVNKNIEFFDRFLSFFFNLFYFYQNASRYSFEKVFFWKHKREKKILICVSIETQNTNGKKKHNQHHRRVWMLNGLLFVFFCLSVFFCLFAVFLAFFPLDYFCPSPKK